jgi:hypothetical protein
MGKIKDSPGKYINLKLKKMAAIKQESLEEESEFDAWVRNSCIDLRSARISDSQHIDVYTAKRLSIDIMQTHADIVYRTLRELRCLLKNALQYEAYRKEVLAKLTYVNGEWLLNGYPLFRTLYGINDPTLGQLDTIISEIAIVGNCLGKKVDDIQPPPEEYLRYHVSGREDDAHLGLPDCCSPHDFSPEHSYEIQDDTTNDSISTQSFSSSHHCEHANSGEFDLECIHNNTVSPIIVSDQGIVAKQGVETKQEEAYCEVWRPDPTENPRSLGKADYMVSPRNQIEVPQDDPYPRALAKSLRNLKNTEPIPWPKCTATSIIPGGATYKIYHHTIRTINAGLQLATTPYLLSLRPFGDLGDIAFLNISTGGNESPSDSIDPVVIRPQHYARILYAVVNLSRAYHRLANDYCLSFYHYEISQLYKTPFYDALARRKAYSEEMFRNTFEEASIIIREFKDLGGTLCETCSKFCE